VLASITGINRLLYHNDAAAITVKKINIAIILARNSDLSKKSIKQTNSKYKQ
jgi:hypothetical protein